MDNTTPLEAIQTALEREAQRGEGWLLAGEDFFLEWAHVSQSADGPVLNVGLSQTGDMEVTTFEVRMEGDPTCSR